jgi:hypothetical protein
MVRGAWLMCCRAVPSLLAGVALQLTLAWPSPAAVITGTVIGEAQRVAGAGAGRARTTAV